LFGRVGGGFNQVSLTTGTNPSSVAIGDLNGDGHLDLAVANAGSNTVSVLLYNGIGVSGFAAATPYATGGTPEPVAVGDLNGDGRPDLAVANTDSNTVSVLLGNGDGTFQAQTQYPTGLGPASVAIRDLNGDGKLDLAVANAVSNNVTVLLNDIAPPPIPPVPPGTTADMILRRADGTYEIYDIGNNSILAAAQFWVRSAPIGSLSASAASSAMTPPTCCCAIAAPAASRSTISATIRSRAPPSSGRLA